MNQPVAKPAADEEIPDWVGAQMRTCIGCTQTDNHPKMIMASVGGTPGQAAEIYWHHDCYVLAKAPGWEEIHAAIAGAEGATGHGLRRHLMRDAGTLPEGE